jgi:hypothetical protein
MFQKQDNYLILIDSEFYLQNIIFTLKVTDRDSLTLIVDDGQGDRSVFTENTFAV